MTVLAFKALCDFPRGTIFSLLGRSYSEWASADPGLLQEWERGWRQYDEDVHCTPDTIGQSGFVSCLAGSAIGFGSWDPREFPTAHVGHNCILPAFRGNGYGTVQLERITTLLRNAGFTRAVARTGDVAFFAAAKRMYESCGFVTVASHASGSAAPFRVAEYQLVL